MPEGTTVGDFEVVAVTERGDALTGYAALSLRDNREVRLMEFLPPGLCRRAGAEGGGQVVAPVAAADDADRVRYLSGLRRFLNHGRTLAHLAAPGLPKVIACWPDRGTAYWVAAADGGRRLDRWRAGREAELTEAAVWHMADRMIGALQALHRVHCLHLELSPAHVAIVSGSEPVLLEAVSAWRLLDSRSAQARAQYQGHFAAPELNRGDSHGEDIGPWTDVYALAATLFWIVTGEAPPRAADRAPGDVRRTLDRLGAGRYSSLLLNAIEDGLCLVQQARSDWFASWAEVCRRSAAAATVFDDLLPAIAPVPMAEPAPPAADPQPASRERRITPSRPVRGHRTLPVFWMAGAAAALAVIVILLWPPAPSEAGPSAAATFDWTPKPIKQALPH